MGEATRSGFIGFKECFSMGLRSERMEVSQQTFPMQEGDSPQASLLAQFNSLDGSAIHKLDKARARKACNWATAASFGKSNKLWGWVRAIDDRWHYWRLGSISADLGL